MVTIKAIKVTRAGTKGKIAVGSLRLVKTALAIITRIVAIKEDTRGEMARTADGSSLNAVSLFVLSRRIMEVTTVDEQAGKPGT